MSSPDLSIAIRTLITGGFVLEQAQRNPGYVLLRMRRYDEFGAIHNYCFALAENALGDAQVAAAKIAADHYHAQLILISSSDSKFPTVEWSRFINLFGGPVFSRTPLDPAFCSELIDLGHNRLPKGMSGKADDLFEAYVQSALEFILGSKVKRYGQERRFEARPDGIVLAEQGFSALYDAKAYSGGYDVTLDSIRQFKSYIDDFSRRYSSFLPRLNTFMVISGKFANQERSLIERSRDLSAECNVPLCCLTAVALAEIIQLLSTHPRVRHSINWARIFADPVVDPKRVQKEVRAIVRDGIVPEI